MSGENLSNLRVMGVITLLWIIGLAIEVIRSAPAWQIRTCAIGTALGLIGLLYSYRRLKRESAI
jgi:hypothetical protein